MDIGSKLILGLGVVAMLLVLVTLIASVVAINRTSNQASKNEDFIVCVTNWANRTTDRSAILTPLNVERQETLDKVIRDFAQIQNPKVSRVQLRKQFFAHLKVYIKASDAYSSALKEHPLPMSPKLLCANDK